MLRPTLQRVTSALHSKLIFGRRVEALASNVAALVPTDARTLLDVGCGDGTLARSVVRLRPGLDAVGLEIQARPSTAIPVTEFDGRSIPYGDGSFDVVLIVDVLHHAEDPAVLLREAARVASRCVIVKDHLTGAWLSHARLRAMDWVGNIGHGVPLRYAYWSPEQWEHAFEQAGLKPVECRERLGLYRFPLQWLFEKRLHFVSKLIPGQNA